MGEHSFGDKYKLDYVVERYIGRKRELILIESELGKLIDKINKGQFSILNSKNGNITAKEINDSTENKNIQKLFKKLFNLKDFDLLWVYTPVPQAATPCKTLQMLDMNYKVKEDGVDYNKKLHVSVFVQTGMVTHSKLNAGEVLAILLHEIGHNFYNSVFHILSRINPIVLFKDTGMEVTKIFSNLLSTIGVLALIDIVELPRLIHMSIRGWVDNSIDKLKIRKIVNVVQEYMIVMSVFTPATIQAFIKILTDQATFNKSIVDPGRIFFNYNVEKHADSFAVDYGYGKELASGLNKIDLREDNVVYNIPVFNWIKDFDSVLHDLTFQTLSGYPTIHNRQTSALTRLKKAQKDPNLPQHLKKELDEQIKYFEEYYDNYMSIENDENKKRIFTWTYRSIINTVFKGNADIRELIYKLDKTNPDKDLW